MIFGEKGGDEMSIEIGDAYVKESKEETFLGITFDRHWKTANVYEGVRLISIQLLPNRLDVLRQKFGSKDRSSLGKGFAVSI